MARPLTSELAEHTDDDDPVVLYKQNVVCGLKQNGLKWRLPFPNGRLKGKSVTVLVLLLSCILSCSFSSYKSLNVTSDLSNLALNKGSEMCRM